MCNYPTGAAHDPEAPYNKEPQERMNVTVKQRAARENERNGEGLHVQGRGYSCAARHAQHVCACRRLAGGGS